MAVTPSDKRKDSTDPRRANLCRAELSGARVVNANLSGADLTLAKLSGANLRKLFRDGGYRDQERQITYAIRQVRNNRLLHSDQARPLDRIEGVFNYLLFDLTTKWGMGPSRASSTMGLLILVFSLACVIALRSPSRDGIWRAWSEERVRDDLGTGKPELLSLLSHCFSIIKMIPTRGIEPPPC